MKLDASSENITRLRFVNRGKEIFNSENFKKYVSQFCRPGYVSTNTVAQEIPDGSQIVGVYGVKGKNSWISSIGFIITAI